MTLMMTERRTQRRHLYEPRILVLDEEAVACDLIAEILAEAELHERLLTPALATTLANAIEVRDPYLHGHCERLAALAVRMATKLQLSAVEVEAVRLGAIL